MTFDDVIEWLDGKAGGELIVEVQSLEHPEDLNALVRLRGVVRSPAPKEGSVSALWRVDLTRGPDRGEEIGQVVYLDREQVASAEHREARGLIVVQAGLRIMFVDTNWPA